MPFPPTPRFLPAIAVALVVGGLYPRPAGAGVVVLGNRTDTVIDFTLGHANQQTTRHRLASRSLMPIPVSGKVGIAFKSGGETRRFVLPASSIYYFVSRNEKLLLGKVVLPAVTPGGRLPPPPKSDAPIEPLHSVPVMLLVDDDEPAVRRLWEKRLRDRLAEASKIFQWHCRVRFEVVAVGTWRSDNRIMDFSKSLREFELKVSPTPAKLAIGFTSQYKRPSLQRVHLGGTRGPMYPHILIREWAQHVSHTERVEVLVHELGHYLGATHSPEASSVMRPKLGDHRSHARGFRIGFDPLNTFIMYLLAEELRAGRYRGFSRLHPHTKAHLKSAYTAIARMMPDDESTENYLNLLGR